MPSCQAMRASLDKAYESLAQGDAGEAERRAKAVSAIVRAELDIAQFVAASAPNPADEDAETIRAQLRSRFRRLADAEHAGAPTEVLERIATATTTG